jgi:hypothetical protein
MSVTSDPPKAPPLSPGPEQPTDRPRWYRRRGWVVALIALFVGIGLGAAASGSKTKTTTVTAPAQTVVNTVPGPTKTVAGPTKTVAGPTKTVTTTVTRSVTVTPPTTPDQSAFVEAMLADKAPGGSGPSTRSHLQDAYPGATIQISGAQCVEAGTTQHYQCTVSYTVSGSSDPSQDGSYTLSATGSCDNAGNCQTLESAVDTASRQ